MKTEKNPTQEERNKCGKDAQKVQSECTKTGGFQECREKSSAVMTALPECAVNCSGKRPQRACSKGSGWYAIIQPDFVNGDRWPFAEGILTMSTASETHLDINKRHVSGEPLPLHARGHFDVPIWFSEERNGETVHNRYARPEAIKAARPKARGQAVEKSG
ncbi:uncharacterized protein BBA_08604 [Beauveria bassiana ARSEF 2860]|uniref:Uncharacterized protein n=1 Tax=Beauveria bassiana (strain ARSEF 2860) TaxID=655819 RepID=J4VVN1_BEAB2|nr:uncharacterized protein BBA_08604 [Beauveria bassiana ARSEF 2860]EJP62520.1 hypothetical protein BBA_08604 [Beauveria bassiana ARSEF 2860]